MFCEKCGHKIAEGEVFCSNCGAQVVQQEPEPPVQEVPVQQPLTEDGMCRQIIGSNSDYYLEQFVDIQAGGKGRINWASFFLTLYHAACG